MSKSKKGSKENPLSVSANEFVDNILGKEKTRSFQITEAHIKDDFCNYSFEITDGVGLGDKLSVKGKAGTIKESLRNAFNKFNVHLAYMDDVFKNSGIEIEDIDKLHMDDHTLLYSVTGFKINGGEENESIILIGNKYISSGGRIILETPRIFIHELSSYKWYNELKSATDTARNEVALYKEGNYIPVEDDIEVEDPGQLKMSFSVVTKDNDDDMSDFENAAVK